MSLNGGYAASGRGKTDIQRLIVGEGRLAPLIIRLALPAVMMMYLQGAYNIVDTIWVGQLMGRASLAGIAAGGFVLWSIFGMTYLISTGVSAIIARRIGEENWLQAERVATRGIWYAFILSLMIGVSLWILTPGLFWVMGTDPEVTAEGKGYLRVILMGCPLIFLSFVIYRIFQASGDTLTPMWLTLFTLLLNAVLDPVLMLGLFGFPRLGIAGAALATVIARLHMVVAGLWLLVRKQRIGMKRIGHPVFRFFPHSVPVLARGSLQLRPGEVSGWDWPLFAGIIRIGFPNAVANTMFPFVYMVLTRLAAGYGSEHVASLRIGHTVEGLSFFLAVGFSVAAGTCVGQNMGAGNPGRAERSSWISCGIVSLCLSVFSLLFYVLSEKISAVFTSDPLIVAASSAYLEILALSQVFMGIELVLTGAFAGAGDTTPPMAILVPFNLMRIPLAYGLTGPFGLGVNGIWWALSSTSIVKGWLLAAWFRRGGWKRKKV